MPSKQEVVLQEEGELTELVSKIVSITNVSDDEAVFALNGNNYDLQLALEELMKQQPDANKVQQKTSRRKKTTSLKETEDVSSDKEKNSSEKDSKKKDGRKDKFDRSQKRSGNASSSNRRDKNRSQKSEHESATNGPQDVQPLMEIQTGNWHDAESRMSNHIDSMPFESNQGTSGSRGRYQRRERGGMNRADHNRHPQHQDGIGYQDQKDDIDGNNQSAFSQQPFVVGTFDAKAVDFDGHSKSPSDDRPYGMFKGPSSRGGRGGGRFGRGGGRSNAGFNGRNSNRGDSYGNGPNSGHFSTGTFGDPRIENSWPSEEKWDMSSDGDWRGREFTRKDVEPNLEESSAVPETTPSPAQPSIFNAGVSPNSSAALGYPTTAGEVVSATGPTVNGDAHPTEKYALAGYDSTSHKEQSENLLLKLLHGGEGAAGQQYQPNHQLTSTTNTSVTPSNSNKAQEDQQLASASSHFAAMSISSQHMNTSTSQNNLPSKGKATVVTTSTDSGPDVPPGFNETLNSENLEFGQPPSVAQLKKSQLSSSSSANMPLAPVELPSPVAQFSIKTSVNFGEIDPNYITSRAQFGNLPAHALVSANMGGVSMNKSNLEQFYNGSRYGSQVTAVPGHDMSVDSSEGHDASGLQTLMGGSGGAPQGPPAPHLAAVVSGGGSSAGGSRNDNLSISAKGGGATSGGSSGVPPPQSHSSVNVASSRLSAYGTSNDSAMGPMGGGDMSKYGHQRQQLTQQQQSVLYQLQNQQRSNEINPSSVPSAGGSAVPSIQTHQQTGQIDSTSTQGSSTMYTTTPSKLNADKGATGSSSSYFASASSSNDASMFSKMNQKSPAGAGQGSTGSTGAHSQQEEQKLRYSGQNSSSGFLGRPSHANSYQPSNYGKSGHGDSLGASKGSVGGGGGAGSGQTVLNSNVANFMSVAASVNGNNTNSSSSSLGTGSQGAVASTDHTAGASNTHAATGSSSSHLANQFQQLHQQHQMQQQMTSPLGVTSPTGFQMGYVAATNNPLGNSAAAGQSGLLQQHPSGAPQQQQVRYSQQGIPGQVNSSSAGVSGAHQYQVISNNVSVHPTNFGQFLQSANSGVRAATLMDHGASNHSGQDSYSLNANKLGPGGNASRKLDDSTGQTNSSPTINVGTQNMAQGANASAAAATGIPPSFFYPYAAANFPGTNQPPGLYHTAAALFTAANPAVFTPFGPLAQLQAIQQHNQQVGQTASSMGNSVSGSSVSTGVSQQQQQNSAVAVASKQQQSASASGGAGGGTNQNSSVSANQQQQHAAAYANGTSTQFQPNSYFQTLSQQQQQSGGDYMNSSAGDYTKYGQQMMSVAGGAQHGGYNSVRTTGVVSGGSLSAAAGNKAAVYANTNSDYSSMYHAKGLDKNSSAAGMGGLSSAGLASTSPPQGTAATGTPNGAAGPTFNAYLAATNYGAQYNHQFLQQAAAAQSQLVHQQQQAHPGATDPRTAAAATSLKLGGVGGQLNVGSLAMHGAKHPGAVNSQHTSVAAAAGYGGAPGGASAANYSTNWRS